MVVPLAPKVFAYWVGQSFVVPLVVPDGMMYEVPDTPVVDPAYPGGKYCRAELLSESPIGINLCGKTVAVGARIFVDEIVVVVPLFCITIVPDPDIRGSEAVPAVAELPLVEE